MEEANYGVSEAVLQGPESEYETFAAQSEYETFAAQSEYETFAGPTEEVVIKAEAEFDYDGEQEDEISFTEGQIFIVHNKEVYDGWAEGEINGKRGVFPNNFVRFFEETVKPNQPPPLSPKPPRRTTTAPPSSGPPSSSPSMPPSDPPRERKQSTSAVAAKAAFLDSALGKSGGFAGSLPRGMKPSALKNFSDSLDGPDQIDRSKTLSSGFSAAELRQFALEHKDDYKRSKKHKGKTRAPPDPKSVPSIDEVKFMISAPKIIENTPPPTAEAPRRISISAVTPPKPPPSPTPDNYTKPIKSRVPANKPASGPPSFPGPKPSAGLSKPPTILPNKPAVSPIFERKSNVPQKKDSPASTAPPPTRAPTAAPTRPVPSSPVPPSPQPDSDSEGDDYMDMDPVEQENLPEVFSQSPAPVQAPRTSPHPPPTSVSSPPPTPATSSQPGVSEEEMESLKSKIETLEANYEKMRFLFAMLQSELDDEINHRKQIETEVSRLKKTVAVLQ